jgi:hypothetical protein
MTGFIIFITTCYALWIVVPILERIAVALEEANKPKKIRGHRTEETNP